MNDQRAKAAKMFGKAFMDAAKPVSPPKNYAAAQQKVANDRPIATYKCGGQVKKAKFGGKILEKAQGGAADFQSAVNAMPQPVMRAVGGAGKTRKGQAPIKKAQGGVGKLRHNVPMKGVKPHKGIGV